LNCDYSRTIVEINTTHLETKIVYYELYTYHIERGVVMGEWHESVQVTIDGIEVTRDLYDNGQVEREESFDRAGNEVSKWWYENGQQSSYRYTDPEGNEFDLTWYENSQKRRDTYVYDGHMIMKEFQENGQITLECHYMEYPEDSFLRTDWYDSGQKKSIRTGDGIFSDGYSLYEWYENDLPKVEHSERGSFSYYNNGQICSEFLADSHTYKEWFENGQLKSQVIHEDTDIEEREEWFDEEGKSIEPLTKHRSKPSFEEERELMKFMEDFFKPEDDRVLGSDFLYLHL